MLAGFERIRPVDILHPACSCVEEQALLLERISIDDVQVEPWDICDVLEIDEARALRSVDMHRNLSDSLNVRICVAEPYRFVVQGFVVDEPRQVVTDMCVCTIVKSEVIIVLVSQYCA